MPCTNCKTATLPWRLPRTRAPASPGCRSIRSSGFTASVRIFLTQDAMANAVTAPALTGPEPGFRPPLVTAAGSAADRHPENSDFCREARSTWARLLRKISEVDPLVCRCGARMRIVSFITDPRVVDRILRHRERERCRAKDPFEPRAPPGACTRSGQ